MAAPAVVGPAPERPATTTRAGVRLLPAALAVVLLAALTGWLGAVLRPPAGTARAVLVVSTVDDEDSAARALRTQAELLRGRAVLVPVAAATGTTPDRLARAVEVTADGDTGLVTLEVRGPGPDAATGLADRIVSEYLRAGHVADVPADGMVRTRLLLPPHPVPERLPTPAGGALLGSATGALAAGAATVAVLVRRRGRC